MRAVKTDRPSLIRVSLIATLTWIVAVGVVALPGILHGAEEVQTPRGPFENIHVIDFDGEIEALMLAYVTRRVDAAKDAGADCIVLRVDSPGGTVFHGKKIGDMLLGIPDSIHVVAWVPQMALSGAAFISLACDEVIMTSAASLGDSQPIVQGDGGKPEPVGEKYESPLRAWFRGYAEKNGYPPALAEAMVTAKIEVLQLKSKKDGSIYYVRGTDYRAATDDAELVPGHMKSELVQDGPAVSREGELLTMTGEDALKFGFIKRRFDGGLPRNEEQVLAALKAPGATVTFTKMSFSEKASKWLLEIAGILSALVALAILLFIWQGPGLMTIIGGIALLIVVLINVTAEQLHGFPLFLILLGVAMLVAEVFVLPGFGIAGILGMASLAIGFLFLTTGSTLGDTGAIDHTALVEFGLQFVFTAIVGLVLLLTLSRFFPRVGPAKRMILQPSGAPAMADGPAAPDAPSIGSIGTASTTLRPAGTAEFDEMLVDVVSDGAFVNAGQQVRVIAVEGDRVTVTEVEA